MSYHYLVLFYVKWRIFIGYSFLNYPYEFHVYNIS
nr:MAG TPA: hypothetical protein [Caudoviricetes sp.]